MVGQVVPDKKESPSTSAILSVPSEGLQTGKAKEFGFVRKPRLYTDKSANITKHFVQLFFLGLALLAFQKIILKSLFLLLARAGT